MNEHLHRVIFNAARGQRVAVHEAASSNSGRGRLKATAVAGLVALASHSQSALAQIAGDPSAPANQRPVVVTAPNGTPLVNIQTPSAGGVSRNSYRQFDVGSQGAILNNSRTQTQSQLGGWVQGNPYLANGPARIILNEVNSTNPSQLRGYVEVAGQRAEVIIANPAGIQVRGGGFINASRATLTTGTPKFNEAGSLESFLVRGGTVTVEGAGLDASKTDYAAILARAIQVNAGIWASELKVVAGTNEVSADAADHSPGSAKPVSSNGPAPTFALDVAQLGGMYAGKIMLIGTEDGVGVRNAGEIGAGPGGVIVTADGRLENVGKLYGGRVNLQSTADIENKAGGTIEARTVELASAADVINRGTIRQTGSADLRIEAPTLANTQGGVIGMEPVAPSTSTGGGAEQGGAGQGASGSSGATPGATTGTQPAAGAGASDPQGAGSGGTAATAQPPAPPSPGRIVAANAVRNDGGRIYAGGDIQLQTPNIDNSGGTLSVSELSVSGPRFANAGGTLNVTRSFTAQVDAFDNAGGKLNAGTLDIDVQGGESGDLDNRQGTLHSNSATRLKVDGQLLNAGGETSSAGTLDATVQGKVDNTAGQLAANEGLRLDAGALINGDGNGNGGSVVQSGAQALQVNVREAIDNSGGRIAGNGDVALRSSSLGNQGGQIQAGAAGSGTGQLSVQTTGTLDNSENGKLSAAGDITLKAQDLVNTKGEVAAAGQLDVAVSDAVHNTRGSLLANQNLSLAASTLDNTGGSVGSAQGNAALSTQGQTVNRSGKLLAGGALALANAGLDNTEGQAVGSSLGVDTTGAGLNNERGTLASSQGTLDIRSGALDNSAGVIAAQGDLQATTGAVLNANGGQLGSNAALRVDTQGQAFDNRV